MTKEKKKSICSEHSMKSAIEQVLENKMTIRQASFHISIPKNTLADRIKQVRGGGDVDMKPLMCHFKKTFSEELETKLVEHLIDLENKMMPMIKRF
ncbi:CENP-B N-terminal DNA-binding domain [Popillia japonica]|uniref:CENP-B N-terminal DNA-binding domain n=1 Tax=Popillia japonica TaxID=7064 RepID=A0AAW1IAX6_POPJA